MTISNEGTASVAQVSESTQTESNNGSSGSVTTKLHGRAFYESIGSPKFVLAPMVDQSEFVSPLSHNCTRQAELML